MSYLEYKNYYFIGIGGIGMSAMAEYVLSINKNIAGYDREESFSTNRLESLGIKIINQDNPDYINLKFKENKKTLVVYTPAISSSNSILKYFKKNKFKIIKRSDLLAEVVNSKFCIAIAGTHGKTTTTSILSHILFNSKLKFTSFIGGIIRGYESNIILNGNKIFLVEADEYDKTFLKIKPNIASIINIDGDHYDIYSNIYDLKKSFKKFTKNLKEGGILFHDSTLDFNGFSFGFDSNSNAQIINLTHVDGKSIFDIKINEDIFKNVELNMPGTHNAMNALVAFLIAIELKVEPQTILNSLKSFPGVKRRFSIELHDPKVFIDDYAHHPSEILSVYNSIISIYPNKKNLVIFQPHLFSRTKDFLIDFARALEKFDKIALLDIYPAREEPIKGISSKSILDHINNKNKLLISKSEIYDLVKEDESELIISMGAGDIGNEVESIKQVLIESNEN
jgi:UDP-N-acetylmuramate--alanine ligase